MPNRMKALYDQVVFERRILLACTILIGLSVCVWAVAIGTDHWLTAIAPGDGNLTVDVNPRNGSKNFEGGYSGLFKACCYGYFEKNSERTPYRECVQTDMFPQDMMNKKQRMHSDKTLENYARTDVSFAIISLFVMIMGFGFSIYTFRNPRYMFKRLAGGIDFITCACTMVVIQVFIGYKEYGSKPEHWIWIFPKESELSYGYSLILAWFVFLANLVAGFAFMIFSRKRKRDRAPNDELAMADEPTIIGR